MKTAEVIYKENGFTDDMTLPKHLVIMLMEKNANQFKEEIKDGIGLVDEFAKAVKQTFKQYERDPNKLNKESGEYEILFLYPANNKAYQMLTECLKKYNSNKRNR